MTVITLDGWSTSHEVPDELAAQIADLNSSYVTLLDAVKEWRVKEQTAREHPTKDMRILAWKAKCKLVGLIPGAVVEMELWG